MKLVTYNVQYGVGRDGRYDLRRIADSIAGADIIALQEVTLNFMRNGGADMVAGLSELLPDFFTSFGAAMDIDFGVRDTAGRPLNRRLQFGNMVLSRWPIVSSRNLLLPRTRRLNRGNLQRGALEALVMAPSGPLRIYSVHLDHVDLEERLAQIRHLKERVYAYPLEGGGITGSAEYGFQELPCPEEFVLLGDFNMLESSPEYVAMTGVFDPAEDRQVLLLDQPVDAFLEGERLPEGSVSWVSDTEPGRNSLIDYVFVHPSLSGHVRRSWIDADAAGSDHLPVWVEMD